MLQLGQKLATVAYDLYPKLEKRVPYFQFSVVDKEAAGTASNAEGDIVLFRGLQYLALNDEALNFIIAREMGHVIGQHHTRNTATKLIISAIASVVFPVAGIIAASSTAAQASTISSVITSAASTATSYVGSKVAMVSVKPSQLAESDAIANSMLESQGLSYHQVLNGLPEAEENATSWLKDLQKSKLKLQARLKMQDYTIALAKAAQPQTGAVKNSASKVSGNARKSDTSSTSPGNRKAPQKSSARGGSSGRTGGASAGADASYIRRLVSHIQRHKRYPKAAERAGIRGTVGLLIRISGSGGLTAVSIRKGSGNGMLDSDAAATARRASPFPTPPNGQGFSFSVSLRYAP